MAKVTSNNQVTLPKLRLFDQATERHRSMEEEARRILKAGLTEEPVRGPNLAESIRRRMAPIGSVELGASAT